MREARHAVAVIGGAIAGAEAAGIFADRGILVVVFEQNDRPYGKIEDGLPRWHVALRRQEYERIDSNMTRPGVHFVPRTKIGRDLDFADLVREWGFSAILLANGAWRDRPLPIPGIDQYVGRGLVYQNPFIYWFNHFIEKSYRGPRYETPDGVIVVGGGLASIDVVKALQLETTRHALAARGIDEEMLELEHKGIPEVLGRHGLRWEDLGLQGCTLYYRRNVEDMPLLEYPDGADEPRRLKVQATRRKILEKAMDKYLFKTETLLAPKAAVIEGDRLAGIVFQRMRFTEGRLVPVAGETVEARGPMVISSIGSIPEAIEGVPMEGELFRFIDWNLGTVEGYEGVFASGNVVTGKGNIVVSRKHGIQIAQHVVEHFLGLGGQEGAQGLIETSHEATREAALQVVAAVDGKPRLSTAEIERLLRRVRSRQAVVGYQGSYREWLERVTPPDLV